MKEIRNDIVNWNHENAAKTKSVHLHVTMEMLDEREQAEIETVFKDFTEKIKGIVPEEPPAPGEQIVC